MIMLHIMIYSTLYNTKVTAHPPQQPCAAGCSADACKTHPCAPPCAASRFSQPVISLSQQFLSRCFCFCHRYLLAYPSHSLNILHQAHKIFQNCICCKWQQIHIISLLPNLTMNPHPGLPSSPVLHDIHHALSLANI